jgi:hypothetical protein
VNQGRAKRAFTRLGEAMTLQAYNLSIPSSDLTLSGDSAAVSNLA